MQWRFGPFRLDLEHACLWHGAHRVPLRPKTFDLLVYLVTHAGELVSKAALLEAVWPETSVAEGVLTTSIGELRKVLRETAKHPQCIATVHRRGYRFVAPVTAVDHGETAASTPARAPRSVVPSCPVFVDREAELAQLQQWWTAACHGERQIGLVAGEAGIGKTTLVDAFLAQLDAQERPWIGRGQCIDHYGAGEAYLPLLEALGQGAHAADGASLIAVLRQHAPSWLLQLPALLSPHDVQTLQQQTRGATRERMLRELAEAVEILAQESPWILVLEDLHWGDASTMDWLAYMARRRAAARLLVLGTYRPVDAVVRAHPIRAIAQELRVHGQCEELTLTNLSEAGVTAYLEQRLGQTHLAHDFIWTMYRRTNGNPLFLATVVDAMLRHGPPPAGTDGWQRLSRGPAPGSVDIPESLRLLIDQQLAHLRPDERACLEAASVAGQVFSAAAVAAGLDMAVEEVEAQYATLARRGQFVQACGTEEWPDGTIAARYSFLHALYHEFLYEQVPVSRRTRWHQQVGVRLEAGYGARAQEMAAELAAHFVRGRAYGKAVEYLQYAGENALRRSAPREAIQHLTGALACLHHLPDTPARARHELGIQFTLATALLVTQGLAALGLEQAYLRAQELCTQLGEIPQFFAASFGLFRLYMARAEFDHASALGEHVLRLAEHHQDRTLLIGAHEVRSCTLFHLGQFVQAHTHMEAGVTLYVPNMHDTLVTLYGVDLGILCHSWSALTLCVLGYPDQGLQRNDEARAHARAVAHPFTLAYTLLYAAFVHYVRREIPRVREQTEAVMALATEYGCVDCLHQGMMLHGWACVLQGQHQDGMAEIHQGLDGYRASGQTMDRPYYLALLAEAYGCQGQAEAGLAALAEALRMVGAMPGYLYEAALYQLQGALLQTGPLDRPGVTQTPEACFQQALTIARRQQAKAWELRAAISLSHLWQQQGKRAEAYALLAPIYDWFTEGFDTADLQEARTLLEELAG